MLFDTWGKLIQYDKGGEDIEGGGAPKFFGARKEGPEEIRGGGGSKNLYTSKPTGGGGGLLKN